MIETLPRLEDVPRLIEVTVTADDWRSALLYCRPGQARAYSQNCIVADALSRALGEPCYVPNVKEWGLVRECTRDERGMPVNSHLRPLPLIAASLVRDFDDVFTKLLNDGRIAYDHRGMRIGHRSWPCREDLPLPQIPLPLTFVVSL